MKQYPSRSNGPSVLPGHLQGAASLYSVAWISHRGRSLAMASAMAPLPVPRSAIRQAACLGIKARAASTSNSVLGTWNQHVCCNFQRQRPEFPVSPSGKRSARRFLRRPTRSRNLCASVSEAGICSGFAYSHRPARRPVPCRRAIFQLPAGPVGWFTSCARPSASNSRTLLDVHR